MKALHDAAQALWDFVCGALWSLLALGACYYFLTH